MMLAKLAVAVMAAAAASGGVAAVDPQCDGAYVSNPFDSKPCECAGQIYMQDECSNAFWCADAGANTGCYTECAADEVVQFDFTMGTAFCTKVDDLPGGAVCPGNFKLNCESDDVGENFTGDEDCPWCPNGGLTMRRDCREAFVCYSLFMGGGRSIVCDEDHIVKMDFYKFSWECVPDDGQCPGLGGYQLGCPPEDVVPTLTPPAVDVANPFETCLCEGQFFSNQNCTQAFFCNENVQENRGNLTVCPDDQIIRPNFLQDTVQCIDRVSDYQCPGSFYVNCAEDDIGTPDSSKCECDGQVWVTADCREGFYCYRDDGNDLSCPSGEIIDIDISAFSWRCVQDQGQCPGGGGYYIGDCGNSEVTVPPSTMSTTTGSTTTGGSTTTVGSTTTGGSTTTATTSGAPMCKRSMGMTVVLSSMIALLAYLLN